MESVKTSAQADAQEWKKKGNDCVKANDFSKAARYYTEAIRWYKFDPAFFTNRALCYLKLQKYPECIEDCSIAIHLDETSVKAFYRRMQANEALGNVRDALTDCETVLRLEPNNKEAKRSFDALTGRLQKINELEVLAKKETINKRNITIKNSTSVKPQRTAHVSVPWTKFEELTDVRIDFMDRPPHLRPNQPLQTIEVTDVTVFDDIDEPMPAQPITVVDDPKTVAVDISNNNIEEPRPSLKPAHEEINKNETQNVVEHSAPNPADVAGGTPTTTAYFHVVWSSLQSDDDRYHLLKV